MGATGPAVRLRPTAPRLAGRDQNPGASPTACLRLSECGTVVLGLSRPYFRPVTDCCHEHPEGEHAHAHGAELRRIRLRALLMALALNAAFMVVEFVVGVLSHSLALMGDAGHMLVDVGALALAAGAEKLSARPGGPNHTFGYRRAPTLGALGNAITMLLLCGILIHEAVLRFADPHPVASIPVLIVGVLGLGVNVASALYLHRQGGHSHNVRGAILHMIGDALGSVAVIASAIVIHATGWHPIDPIMTLVISLLILLATLPLLRETTRTLLQVSPPDVDIEALTASLLAHPEVACVADLHVWELDAGYLVASAALHVNCCEIDSVEELRDALKAELVDRWAIAHVTLELVRESDHPRLQSGCASL